METYSLQEINVMLCSFLEKRLSEMGELPGGLYNYYIQRLATKEILSKEDEMVVDYIRKKESNEVNILEVGGGIGQLGHFLYLLGYCNISICEHDCRRYDACIALGKMLESGASILKQTFPECYRQFYDLVLIVNIVGSFNNLKNDLSFFKKILNVSKILFFPTLYDGKIAYQEALFLFEKNGITYKVVGNGLVLLEGLV